MISKRVLRALEAADLTLDQAGELSNSDICKIKGIGIQGLRAIRLRRPEINLIVALEMALDCLDGLQAMEVANERTKKAFQLLYQLRKVLIGEK